jgi:outer membrane protein OmpA-like peptidoglycan-associated protein
MSDPAATKPEVDKATSSTTPARDEMTELRQLLLKQEQAQIVQLQERLDNPAVYAREVSKILPDALALRPPNDVQLSKALAPTVEEAISASVKRNPQRLVSAIFPLMGPAIRRSIANAFAEMVQSLNKTLEYSLSWRGLRWRLEALRSGKSFAEVVLSHTLLYRVEQVFLIHKSTGLLLQHVAVGSEHQDADLVSGMLTAIQDFVHDSLGTEKYDSLESLRVGGLNIWVEQGQHAVLASVIRGAAPSGLRVVMQETLDSIHVQFDPELEAFDGDTGPFEPTRTLLRDCLRQQLESERKESPRLFWAFAALLIVALGVISFFWIRQRVRWNDYISRLRAEPGIVLVSTERTGGKYVVSGLRDPLGPDPSSFLSQSKVDPNDVVFKWELYQSSQPDYVLKRAASLLKPPAQVTLSFDQGVLTLKGAAPASWIESARSLVAAMPAVVRLDDSGLIDSDKAQSRIAVLVQELESLRIAFETGSSEITSDQAERVEALAPRIKELIDLSQAIGDKAMIRIEGHADRPGTEALNMRLRSERADRVRSILISSDISSASLIRQTDASVAGRTFTRAVTFQVVR